METQKSNLHHHYQTNKTKTKTEKNPQQTKTVLIVNKHIMKNHLTISQGFIHL